MNKFKQQPSMQDWHLIGGMPELTKEQKEGLAIAAYICRMYNEGDVWAEAIKCYGEQMRAIYWMRKEPKGK